MSTPAPTPGMANQYATDFDTAWYMSRSPAERALYYGRPGVPIPEGASQLTVAQYQALYEHLVANPPVMPNGQIRPLVHAIAGWGWGPYEANYDAVNQGVAWWPADEGNVTGSEVITQGEFAGTPPEGTPHTLVTLNVADLLEGGVIGPWPADPAPTPVVISDLVGILELPGQYASAPGVVVPSAAIPVGFETSDTRGKFKLIFECNMFGPTYLWELQPAASVAV
jgi:hypothetical protein